MAVTPVACQEGGEQHAGVAPRRAVILAAGDIGSCESDGDEATAKLLEPDATILALGDLAYERGTTEDFLGCYEPTWGRYRAFTRPAAGNHEYLDPSARGYFEYFGAPAGRPGDGWYSFTSGSWHVIALNSNCGDVGGCDVGSRQHEWLLRDLADHPARCTLAFWHHARFSSGATHGGTTQVAPLWQALHDAGAEVVLAAHEHNYERFSPLDGRGRPEPGRGIRQFVVGTGGRSLYPFGPPVAGSEYRTDQTFGLLRLVLHEDRFDWEFLSVDNRRVVDAGSDVCH